MDISAPLHIRTVCRTLTPDHHESILVELHHYTNLLLKWNQHYNLIGRTTEADIWQRHILDSIQLWPHLPESSESLTDFGSGAGLPVVVLAILAKHLRPQLQLHAIDSSQKKASFLQVAVGTLSLPNLTIHGQRIEHLPPWPSDIITARAFAPLPSLLEATHPFSHTDTRWILLKGINAQEEISNAAKEWQFTSQLHPANAAYSPSQAAGAVLELTHVIPKEATS